MEEGANLISAIFDFITEHMKTVFTFIGDLFSGGVGMLYTEGKLTDLGQLTLLAFIVTAAWFAVRWVRSLITNSIR